MSTNFIKRQVYPVCECSNKQLLLSVPFTDDRVSYFLDSYYEGRIPKEILKEGVFNIVRCKNCELIFQENILSDDNMYLLYEEWISAEASLNKKKLADVDIFNNYAVEIVGISKYLKKKPCEINVLEYGMGWGYWANLAKSFGFVVTGVELSKSRIEFAQNNGLEIINDISQVQSESVDYVYSNQVFEHLPDPKEALQQLSRVLSKKGVIHIQVPNGKGVFRKLQDPNWRADHDEIHPLEHINCFTRNSLLVLAEKASLKLAPYPYRPSFHGIKSMLKSHFRYIENLRSSTEVYLSKN